MYLQGTATPPCSFNTLDNRAAKSYLKQNKNKQINKKSKGTESTKNAKNIEMVSYSMDEKEIM